MRQPPRSAIHARTSRGYIGHARDFRKSPANSAACLKKINSPLPSVISSGSQAATDQLYQLGSDRLLPHPVLRQP